MGWYDTKIYPFCKKQVDIKAYERFIQINEFTKWSSYNETRNLKRLLETGNNTIESRCNIYEAPPFLDHPMVFKNPKTRTVILLYQPYEKMEDIRSKIEAWAIEKGLKALVYGSEYSWYFPGDTCLVIISLPETVVTVGKVGKYE